MKKPILCVFLLMAYAGCDPVFPTETPAASQGPSPTAIPTPTMMPSPNFSPSPTATLSPTEAPVPTTMESPTATPSPIASPTIGPSPNPSQTAAPSPTPSVTPTSQVDSDGDGFYADNDCDDGNASINPGATEVCDAEDVDEDCNDLVDNDDPGTDPSGQSTYYQDLDGDGYGDPESGEMLCEGVEFPPTDCDDIDLNVYPGAMESCNGKDNDCNDQLPTCWGDAEWSLSSWLWTQI